MTTFSVDLLTDIFLLLPAKTLLRFKVVCKLWYNLINDLHFINLHLEQSIATKTNLHFVITNPLLHLVDFDTFENPVKLKCPLYGGVLIVGSCNGLLCLCSNDLNDKSVVLYNPTTQTHKLLPSLPVLELDPLACHHEYIDYGFGFDSVSQDYKCVRMANEFNKETNRFYSQVMVYSLINDSWRRGPDVPHYFDTCIGRSVLLHETVHWVGDVTDDDRLPWPCLAFSLQDENFRSLSLPDFNVRWLESVNVGVLDGCLCVLVSYYESSDVWIMKEYGVAGSWKNVFSVPNVDNGECIEHLDRIISYSRNEKELFVRVCLLQVASLDLVTMRTTNVKFVNFRKCFDAHLCVENLLMLNKAYYDSVVKEEADCKKRKKGKKKGSKKRNSRFFSGVVNKRN